MLCNVRLEFNNNQVTPPPSPPPIHHLLGKIANNICEEYLPRIFAKFADGFKLFLYKCIRTSYCLIQFFCGQRPAEILGKLSSSF